MECKMCSGYFVETEISKDKICNDCSKIINATNNCQSASAIFIGIEQLAKRRIEIENRNIK